MESWKPVRLQFKINLKQYLICIILTKSVYKVNFYKTELYWVAKLSDNEDKQHTRFFVQSSLSHNIFFSCKVLKWLVFFSFSEWLQQHFAEFLFKQSFCAFLSHHISSILVSLFPVSCYPCIQKVRSVASVLSEHIAQI